VSERRDCFDLESVKRRSKGLALSKDRDPGETRLEPLESQQLEVRVVSAKGLPPLVVVIAQIERIGPGPGATHNTVGSGNEIRHPAEIDPDTGWAR
jgi:hypothetical protein